MTISEYNVLQITNICVKIASNLRQIQNKTKQNKKQTKLNQKLTRTRSVNLRQIILFLV